MILGLDLATRTGWSLVNEDTGIVEASGVWDLNVHRQGDGRHNGHMFLALYLEVSSKAFGYDVGVICMERPHHRGGPSTRICVGLSSAAMMAAANVGNREGGVRVMDVPTMTLKKFATGDYRAGKDAMMKAAKGWLGREPVDDNEADSVCVSMWAMSQLKEEK